MMITIYDELWFMMIHDDVWFSHFEPQIWVALSNLDRPNALIHHFPAVSGNVFTFFVADQQIHIFQIN